MSCFLDPRGSFRKTLIGLKTNVILCDSNTLITLTEQGKHIENMEKFTLFNVDCALVIIEETIFPSQTTSIASCDGLADKQASKQVVSETESDTKYSSKIFFYASTSGSCGEVKPIGVTYKCFVPNIASLGYVEIIDVLIAENTMV